MHDAVGGGRKATMRINATFLLAVVVSASACDSSGAPSDAATDGCGQMCNGGAGGTAGAGGTTGAGGAGGGLGGAGGAGGTGGSALCGVRACTSGELCVHPSCGGAPPVCNPLPDGGQCPAGWIARSSCPFGGVQGPGCEAPPCTPPASYCLTPPAACGGNPSCACLPRDVCQGGGACSIISRGEVLCASA